MPHLCDTGKYIRKDVNQVFHKLVVLENSNGVS
jgi:hypothetical protein